MLQSTQHTVEVFQHISNLYALSNNSIYNTYFPNWYNDFLCDSSKYIETTDLVWRKVKTHKITLPDAKSIQIQLYSASFQLKKLGQKAQKMTEVMFISIPLVNILQCVSTCHIKSDEQQQHSHTDKYKKAAAVETVQQRCYEISQDTLPKISDNSSPNALGFYKASTHDIQFFDTNDHNNYYDVPYSQVVFLHPEDIQNKRNDRDWIHYLNELLFSKKTHSFFDSFISRVSEEGIGEGKCGVDNKNTSPVAVLDVLEKVKQNHEKKYNKEQSSKCAQLIHDIRKLNQQHPHLTKKAWWTFNNLTEAFKCKHISFQDLQSVSIRSFDPIHDVELLNQKLKQELVSKHSIRQVNKKAARKAHLAERSIILMNCVDQSEDDYDAQEEGQDENDELEDEAEYIYRVIGDQNDAMEDKSVFVNYSTIVDSKTESTHLSNSTEFPTLSKQLQTDADDQAFTNVNIPLDYKSALTCTDTTPPANPILAPSTNNNDSSQINKSSSWLSYIFPFWN